MSAAIISWSALAVLSGSLLASLKTCLQVIYLFFIGKWEYTKSSSQTKGCTSSTQNVYI